MNDEQLLRYSRQIMLSSIDVEGQQRLLDATAFIVGAGGLGCPAAMYLAAAGIGKLVIADDDDVDLSNLQRQIAHGSSDIGTALAITCYECEIRPEVIRQIQAPFLAIRCACITRKFCFKYRIVHRYK